MKKAKLKTEQGSASSGGVKAISVNLRKLTVGAAAEMEAETPTEMKPVPIGYAQGKKNYLRACKEAEKEAKKKVKRRSKDFQEDANAPSSHSNPDVEAVAALRRVAPRLAATAPGTVIGFAGIGQTSLEPPDCTIAAGSDHVLVAVNAKMKVYTKTGTSVITKSLKDFFDAPSDASVFDPKAIYDQFADRYILMAPAIRKSDKMSWIFVAASKTSDPTGSWWVYHLDATLNGSDPTTYWADYVTIGINNKAVYLCANMFDWSTPEPVFQYAKLRILNRSTLESGGKLEWHDFWDLENPDGTKAFAIQPCHTFGTSDVEWLVNAEKSNPTPRSPGVSLTLWKLSDLLNSSPTLEKFNKPVADYITPPQGKQPGTTVKIDTGDARLQNAVFRSGYVWTCHTVAKDGYAAIRFYQIRASSRVVQQRRTWGYEKNYYFFPAIMVDNSGNAVIVFNRCSEDEYVAARYTGRKSSDQPNTLQNSAQLRAGSASYDTINDRWGDYSGVALDPDGNNIWIYGEHAAALNIWGTWIGKVRF
jgi:hypothetical protein